MKRRNFLAALVAAPAAAAVLPFVPALPKLPAPPAELPPVRFSAYTGHVYMHDDVFLDRVDQLDLTKWGRSGLAPRL
jgi:hypothetical protein